MKYLYLDDVREPFQSANYCQNKNYSEKKWHIVRTYQEFKDYITTMGIPEVVSFDYDLTLESYVNTATDEDKIHEYESGYDCLQYLIEACRQQKRQLPSCLIHSMNPVGRKKLYELIFEGRELLKTMPLET